MRGTIASAILCLAIFHTPDGRELRVDTRHINSLRPAEGVQSHLHQHVNTIVYVSTQNFGIIETIDEAQDAIHHCQDGGE